MTYNLLWMYLEQLLVEEQCPMTADEISDRMRWAPAATARVVSLAVEHGRLTVDDGRYDLAARS